MNAYATMTDLLTRVSDADATSGLNALIAASREIDEFCGRHFYTERATKYFGADRCGDVWVDDVLDIESVTEIDDDLEYTDAWSAGDWWLSPANGWPKTRLVASPNAMRTAPTGDRSLRIVGTFGYGDGLSASPWQALGVTVTASSDSATSLTASASGAVVAGMTLLIESEQVFVSAVSGTTLTARRGVNGTTAAAHTAKAASKALYPLPVVDAAMWLAELTIQSVGRMGLTGEKIGEYEWRAQAASMLKTRADLCDIVLRRYSRNLGV